MNIVKNKNGTITINAEKYGLYKDVIQGTHILIGGQTGAGKSTVIDGLIYTIATSGSVKDYELILIDPKRVSLSKWKDLPHTICYASELNDISRAFDKALYMADSRYKRMEKCHRSVCRESQVYLVIDELADLMLGGKVFKTKLQRLIQIGRASNIHVIAGTQTFLSTVIPTPIKANFTHFLALKVRNQSDSRTLLGMYGAENLPLFEYEKGIGKLIYLSPSLTCTCDFIVYQDYEINHLIKEWKRVTPLVWQLLHLL